MSCNIRWGAEATQTDPKDGAMKCRCFMPGLAMQMLARCKIRSFLLTSGTLSPLSSFAAELRLDFPIVLENPHVIHDAQA